MDVLVKDFFEDQKVVIFNGFQVHCIKDLIQFYRDNATMTEAANMTLLDIEKKLNTALSMNDYTIKKKVI